jgi:rod shape-determining protein MreD
MKKGFILSFLSILLEIILSVFTKMDGYLIPLFAFLTTMYMSLTIKDIKKRLLYCFIVGLFYDMTVTNTLFLNAVLFTFIAWIHKQIENVIYKNQITFLFSFLEYILLYRTMTYLILFLIGYISFSTPLFIKSILSSIILNFLYFLLLKILLKSNNS